jgi:Ricin-type beta-trefoil lectin domain
MPKYSRKLFLAVAATTVMMATMLSVTPAYAAPPWGEGWFQLLNVATGRCVAVQTAVYHSAAISTTCAEFNDQYFRFERVDQVEDTVYYRLRKYNTSLCLYANGTATYAKIKQYECGTYRDQQWNLIYEDDYWPIGYGYQLRNRNSLKCLLGRDGTSVVDQIACDSTRPIFADQVWVIDYYG